MFVCAALYHMVQPTLLTKDGRDGCMSDKISEDEDEGKNNVYDGISIYLGRCAETQSIFLTHTHTRTDSIWFSTLLSNNISQ